MHRAFLEINLCAHWYGLNVSPQNAYLTPKVSRKKKQMFATHHVLERCAKPILHSCEKLQCWQILNLLGGEPGFCKQPEVTWSSVRGVGAVIYLVNDVTIKARTARRDWFPRMIHRQPWEGIYKDDIHSSVLASVSRKHSKVITLKENTCLSEKTFCIVQKVRFYYSIGSLMLLRMEKNCYWVFSDYKSERGYNTLKKTAGHKEESSTVFIFIVKMSVCAILVFA